MKHDKVVGLGREAFEPVVLAEKRLEHGRRAVLRVCEGEEGLALACGAGGAIGEGVVKCPAIRYLYLRTHVL